MTHDAPQPVLQIGAHQTLVRAAAIADPQGLSLAIGFSRTAVQCFRHNPPSPAELEAAIMVVEDELYGVPELAAKQATVTMPTGFIEESGRQSVLLRVPRPAGSSFYLRRTLCRPDTEAIAVSVDNAPNVLSLDQVERLFELLAARSMGRPATSAGIPDDPEFAATLLILRECMHHLKFESVRLEAER